ncbi:hypothetical protein ACSBR2_028638 [Camellia fascicularis]
MSYENMLSNVGSFPSPAFPRCHVPQRALQRFSTCRHCEGRKPRFVPLSLCGGRFRKHRKLVLVSLASRAEHAFCLQHLQRNLRDRLRYTNSMHRAGLVSKLRHCAGRRYGELCSNAAESFNSWVREARNLLITSMVDSIRTKLMRQMAKRRDASQTWTGTICPKMESRLEKAFNEGKSWKVSQSNADVYEVHSFPLVTVDIEHRTCSCFKWQLNGFPCAHAMVAVRKSGRDLNTLVEPFFHVSEYRSTYAASIFPIPTVEQPSFNPNDFIIKPPAIKRPPSRPKKKRILSKGEHVQQIRCSRCGRMGNHNRKTCNEPI